MEKTLFLLMMERMDDKIVISGMQSSLCHLTKYQRSSWMEHSQYVHQYFTKHLPFISYMV